MSSDNIISSSSNKQDDYFPGYLLSDKGNIIIPKQCRQWVKREIYKYCRRLGIRRKDYPTTIVYSVKELNKINGYKPSNKCTRANRLLGCCYFESSLIYINVPKFENNIKKISRTIVHEVIHYKFPGLEHDTNGKTLVMFNMIVDAVLNEGKTLKDLLYGKDKLIIKQKTKPEIQRPNGTLVPQYSYARSPTAFKTRMNVVYHKAKIYATIHKHKTRSKQIIEHPAIQGEVEGHPELKYFVWWDESPFSAYQIKHSIKSILFHLKQQIRYSLYNNSRLVHIVLECNKPKDEYERILLKRQQNEEGVGEVTK
jgi:hypothetical protein